MDQDRARRREAVDREYRRRADAIAAKVAAGVPLEIDEECFEDNCRADRLGVVFTSSGVDSLGRR